MSMPAAIAASRRSASANGDLGGGKMPDSPGEGPAVELVPGVEVDDDACRADAVDEAGLELTLSRLGLHLHLRPGRVASEFLYFAAWAGLAPSPNFAGYRLVRSAAGKKSVVHAFAAESGPRPPYGFDPQVQANRLSARRLKF